MDSRGFVGVNFTGLSKLRPTARRLLSNSGGIVALIAAADSLSCCGDLASADKRSASRSAFAFARSVARLSSSFVGILYIYLCFIFNRTKLYGPHFNFLGFND